MKAEECLSKGVGVSRFRCESPAYSAARYLNVSRSVSDGRSYWISLTAYSTAFWI